MLSDDLEERVAGLQRLIRQAKDLERTVALAESEQEDDRERIEELEDKLEKAEAKGIAPEWTTLIELAARCDRAHTEYLLMRLGIPLSTLPLIATPRVPCQLVHPACDVPKQKS